MPAVDNSSLGITAYVGYVQFKRARSHFQSSRSEQVGCVEQFAQKELRRAMTYFVNLSIQGRDEEIQMTMGEQLEKKEFVEEVLKKVWEITEIEEGNMDGMFIMSDFSEVVWDAKDGIPQSGLVKDWKSPEISEKEYHEWELRIKGKARTTIRKKVKNWDGVKFEYENLLQNGEELWGNYEVAMRQGESYLRHWAQQAKRAREIEKDFEKGSGKGLQNTVISDWEREKILAIWDASEINDVWGGRRVKEDENSSEGESEYSGREGRRSKRVKSRMTAEIRI